MLYSNIFVHASRHLSIEMYVYLIMLFGIKIRIQHGIIFGNALYWGKCKQHPLRTECNRSTQSRMFSFTLPRVCLFVRVCFDISRIGTYCEYASAPTPTSPPHRRISRAYDSHANLHNPLETQRTRTLAYALIHTNARTTHRVRINLLCVSVRVCVCVDLYHHQHILSSGLWPIDANRENCWVCF